VTSVESRLTLRGGEDSRHPITAPAPPRSMITPQNPKSACFRPRSLNSGLDLRIPLLLQRAALPGTRFRSNLSATSRTANRWVIILIIDIDHLVRDGQLSFGRPTRVEALNRGSAIGAEAFRPKPDRCRRSPSHRRRTPLSYRHPWLSQCPRLAGVFHVRSGMTTSGRWWHSSEELIRIARIGSWTLCRCACNGRELMRLTEGGRPAK
jgi:hypothetical protein